MIYEDEILVLREVPYKDNDKILHVYSKKMGKIQIMSRGCRKNNSRLINISHIFSYSRCMLYKSKDMYIIDSAELIDSFYSIRKNLDAFLYGNYILELLSYISQENQPDEKIFYMTVKLFSCLNLLEDKFNVLIGAYEIKLVSMLGYKPEFGHCLICGESKYTTGYFSIKDGGFYCLKCAEGANLGIIMSNDEILYMEKLLKCKFENIPSIDNISDKTLSIVRKFLFYQIGKSDFITLKMLFCN